MSALSRMQCRRRLHNRYEPQSRVRKFVNEMMRLPRRLSERSASSEILQEGRWLWLQRGELVIIFRPVVRNKTRRFVVFPRAMGCADCCEISFMQLGLREGLGYRRAQGNSDCSLASRSGSRRSETAWSHYRRPDKHADEPRQTSAGRCDSPCGPKLIPAYAPTQFSFVSCLSKCCLREWRTCSVSIVEGRLIRVRRS